MQKRNVLNFPRLSELKKQRQKVFLSQVFLIGSIFIAVLVGLVYISRISRLNINAIEVVGNKVIDTEVIKQVVENETSGKYVWLLPKTNIFFYPKNSIKQNLSSQFKRLKDIDVAIKDRNILEIQVSEREPKYLWCGQEVHAEEKCSFLDETGFIFDEAPYFSGEVYFKFYGKLPTDFARFILFKQTLEVIGLKPAEVLIVENGNVEIFLSGKSKPKVILNESSDFQKIAENLQAALTTEPLHSDFKNKYSSLLYLDLRYGNKVYFKFK